MTGFLSALRIFALFVFLGTAAGLAHAQSPATDEAQKIYRDHGDAVYQVQVIDLASGKKNSIGSGFQFTKDGLMATNYHVVSEAIANPKANRLEYLHEKGGTGALKILMADVVNDLAILQMDNPGDYFVELGTSRLPKGTRLFSLGNPRDIGFTIVEGIHNGASNESFVDKIHFSGAINPGMSGGPALSHDGRVTGVNVMTGGNGVGFLVPVEHVRRLKEEFDRQEQGFDFLQDAPRHIERQLLDNQKKNIDTLLEKPWDTLPFGMIRAPGRIHQAFKCWGAPGHEEKHPYRYYWSLCGSQDRIYINDEFDTGSITIRYDQVTADDDLPLPRFYALYQKLYASYQEDTWNSDGMNAAGEKDVTNFTCNDDFVDIDGLRWKTSFCIRRYKKYPQLHDAGLFMALAGQGRRGMMVTMIAQGVSKDSAVKLSRQFLSNITRNDAGDTAKLPPPAKPADPAMAEEMP